MKVSTGIACAVGSILGCLTIGGNWDFAAGCVWMAFANWILHEPKAAQPAGEK